MMNNLAHHTTTKDAEKTSYGCVLPFMKIITPCNTMEKLLQIPGPKL
jgi:hypothetical protein